MWQPTTPDPNAKDTAVSDGPITEFEPRTRYMRRKLDQQKGRSTEKAKWRVAVFEDGKPFHDSSHSKRHGAVDRALLLTVKSSGQRFTTIVIDPAGNPVELNGWDNPGTKFVTSAQRAEASATRTAARQARRKLLDAQRAAAKVDQALLSGADEEVQ